MKMIYLKECNYALYVSIKNASQYTRKFVNNIYTKYKTTPLKNSELSLFIDEGITNIEKLQEFFRQPISISDRNFLSCCIIHTCQVLGIFHKLYCLSPIFMTMDIQQMSYRFFNNSASNLFYISRSARKQMLWF